MLRSRERRLRKQDPPKVIRLQKTGQIRHEPRKRLGEGRVPAVG